MTSTRTEASVRFEIKFDPDMIEAIKASARRKGITPTAWIKMQCAGGLEREGKIK